MKKYLSMVLFALFAFCGVAFAQETGVSDPAAGESGAWGYVLAAVIAVINAVLSFFPNSKDAWWYKLLSWCAARFGK